MTKTCAACLKKRPIELFAKRRDSKDGVGSWCLGCRTEKQAVYRAKYLSDPAKRERNSRAHKKWVTNDPERAKRVGHAAWVKLRGEMLDAYGRECRCCGEDIEEFLTLEHINKDGSLHRKKVGGGANVYRDLKRRGWPKKGYEVLCMNCNWAKRRTGVCPHEKKLKVVSCS